MDDFETLGLHADASLEDVQRAFKRLAKEHHPDRGGEKEAFQKLKAAADRLSGSTSRSTERCEAPSHANKCLDIVRCLLVLTESTVMVLDEQQALIRTGRESSWVTLRAADEAFLCCCVLHGEQLLAIGTSRGRVHIARSQRDTKHPQLAPIAAGDGPVLALVCVSEHLPLLLASVAGRVTLVDHVTGCALQSLDSALLHGVMAETLCQAPTSRPEEEDSTARICIAGADERCGGGLLLCLRMDPDALVLDEDPGATEDALQLDWRATHDMAVYAIAAAEPSLIVVATGSMCVLHERETGLVLRRLETGSGVLYALAINPGGDCLVTAGSEEVAHVFNFPSGTKRAALHMPRTAARSCGLNSATINALAFVDDQTFLSGGYDAATTRWQLELPPAVRGCVSGSLKAPPPATGWQ